MTLGSRYLLRTATRAVREAERERRRQLEAELASYSSPAERADLEALLQRYPDGQTHEICSIMAAQDLQRHLARSPFDRPRPA